MGAVYFYVRPNGRCPACEFYESVTRSMKDKFSGQFETLVRLGKDYGNPERFKPLSGEGKPLWEFKEHDQRLFCDRREFPNGSVQAVLLHGWTKDKRGKTREEDNQVKTALSYRQERLIEESKK